MTSGGGAPALPSQQVDSKSSTSRCDSFYCMLALAAWPPFRLLVLTTPSRIASSFVLPTFAATSLVAIVARNRSFLGLSIQLATVLVDSGLLKTRLIW